MSLVALGVATFCLAGTGASTVRADDYLSGTTTISGQTVSGRTTHGGDGSGGGAGLGGAVFVGDGATVNLRSDSFLGNTAVGGTGGTGRTGGTLNGVAAGGSPGAQGADGKDASGGAAKVNNGNGILGQNGFAGGDGAPGAGGTGGQGGDGSSGVNYAETADYIKTTVENAVSAYKAVEDGTLATLYGTLATEFGTAAAAANASVPPNAALSGALTSVAAEFGVLSGDAGTDAIKDGLQAAAQEAYITALSITSYQLGVSGQGGAGGNGGNGGNGSFGQGGGAGGDGGKGGDAYPDSGAVGGVGGNGGTGGAGGFGAGGGLGGSPGAGGLDGDSAANGAHGGLDGTGGAAGFGGGVGSVGDGSENGTGGGGGSAYGGAVFVQKGGTLNITGNTLFNGNSVFGGSSANGGEAGQAAGTDLFMMKGSTVNLDAGAGNTIEFDGTIADDSKESISGTSIASGQGAGLNVQSGLVILNGKDTYTGQTKISGGVLQAQDGQGVNTNSNINFDGGVLQSNGTFERYLGTGSDRVQWSGSGGFAARGGDLTVKLSDGHGISWDAGSFVPDGSSLLFGSDSADSDVHFLNDINLAGGERTIVNNGGAEGGNLAYLDGVLSNGSLVLGDGSTTGTIALTRDNTFSGTTTIASGTTAALKGDGSIADSSKVTVDGTLDISGANGDSSVTTLAGSGGVALGGNSLSVTNGSTTFAGIIDGSGGFAVSGGTQALSGDNSYTGGTTVASGAGLTLTGAGSIASSLGLTLNGHFDISGTTDGASLKTLGGSGTVALGDKTLTLTQAASIFSGSIGGNGGVTASGGAETLTGTNGYAGATNIASGAKLALGGTGSIAHSSGVAANGRFDISGTDSGAAIKTLSGTGSVDLGAQTLTITDGSTGFGGVVGGSGGLSVTGGTQTLSAANTYTGDTSVSGDAGLTLTGSGAIAHSGSVKVDGVLDIAGTDVGAALTTLSGTGTVKLGDRLLALTDASGTFGGTIAGTGALDLMSGTETLTGTNSYTGATMVADGATLKLGGTGSIAASRGLGLAGTFDISGTDAGAAIATLDGDGSVSLGDRTLTVTNGQTSFSGSVSGTGSLAVSGGTQMLSGASVGTGIVAENGGNIGVAGGSVTAGGSQSALSIVNGGSIGVQNAALQSGGATAYASFSNPGKFADFTLGPGAFVQADDGTLLYVDRTAGGSDGVVRFTIANGGTVSGDIIDNGTKTGDGGTTVIIATGSTWTGYADSASFDVASGATAIFKDGSKIDGTLVAQSGANVFGGSLGGALYVSGDGTVSAGGSITGSAYLHGDLNLAGLLAPGESPGVINTGGNLNASGGAASQFQVIYGTDNPQAGTEYDQTNVAGDLNGTLPVELQRYASTRSTPLGNIGGVELIRVGGDVNGAVVQTNRFTQNGHEVVLDRRTRTVDGSSTVTGTGSPPLDETAFFGAGPLTVYGLRAFVQDETYGLAALTGTLHQDGSDILGTYHDRFGAEKASDGKPVWMRAGYSHAKVSDTVSYTRDLSYGEFGMDVLDTAGFRLGVLGSYGRSRSGVDTRTGTDSLEGNLFSAGLDASWRSNGAYLDAVGQYGYSNWTFAPTAASTLKVDGKTATAALEAGYGFGTGALTVTPWAQVLWQKTDYGTVDSDWVDSVAFTDAQSLQLRSGVRAEGAFDWGKSYAGLSVTHDFLGDKTVNVDNFDFTTGMGGTHVELGTGVQARLAPGIALSTDAKASYAVSGGFTGYQATAGLKGQW